MTVKPKTLLGLPHGPRRVVGWVELILTALLEDGYQSTSIGAFPQTVVHKRPVALALADSGVRHGASACRPRVRLNLGVTGWQVAEVRRRDRFAAVVRPRSKGVLAAELLVPETGEAHDARYVGNGVIACVVISQAPHSVFRLLRSPGPSRRVPEHLVVVPGAADHDGRRCQVRQLNVCEEALERVRTIRIKVELEAPNLSYVSLLAPPSRRVDGIHSEEEVVPPRVQVAKPGLIALSGHTASFYDPLKNRRPLGGPARDGENGDVLDRLKESADVGSG